MEIGIIKRSIRKVFVVISVSCCCVAKLTAQQNDTITLTLQDVVEMAKSTSIASKQAATIKETKYWEYRSFRSNYQPQLSLSGILPGYNKTFTEVQQPD